ncbi:MAG: hypothetical protein ACXVIK_09510 [Halobacteriota archaeon]
MFKENRGSTVSLTRPLVEYLALNGIVHKHMLETPIKGHRTNLIAATYPDGVYMDAQRGGTDDRVLGSSVSSASKKWYIDSTSA